MGFYVLLEILQTEIPPLLLVYRRSRFEFYALPGVILLEDIIA